MLNNHRGQRLLSGIALSAALVATPALGQEPDAAGESGVITSYDAADYDLLPLGDSYRLDTSDRFYPHHSLSGDPRIKDIETDRRIYFGTAGRDSEPAAAADAKHGGLYLELNQRGAEFLFRF